MPSSNLTSIWGVRVGLAFKSGTNRNVDTTLLLNFYACIHNRPILHCFTTINNAADRWQSGCLKSLKAKCHTVVDTINILLTVVSQHLPIRLNIAAHNSATVKHLSINHMMPEHCSVIIHRIPLQTWLTIASRCQRRIYGFIAAPTKDGRLAHMDRVFIKSKRQ